MGKEKRDEDEEQEMERRMGIDIVRKAEEQGYDNWDLAKVKRELKRRKILPIDPSFRIIVLANPPTLKQGYLLPVSIMCH